MNNRSHCDNFKGKSTLTLSALPKDALRLPLRATTLFLLLALALLSCSCNSKTIISFDSGVSPLATRSAGFTPQTCDLASTSKFVERFVVTAKDGNNYGVLYSGQTLVGGPLKPDQLSLSKGDLSIKPTSKNSINDAATPTFLSESVWKEGSKGGFTLFAVLAEKSSSTDGSLSSGDKDKKYKYDGTKERDGNDRVGATDSNFQYTKTIAVNASSFIENSLDTFVSNTEVNRPIYSAYFTFGEDFAPALDNREWKQNNAPDVNKVFSGGNQNISKKANVLASLATLAEKMNTYKKDGNAPLSKSVLVIVDGPDDSRYSQKDIDGFITRIKNAGVHVFILHSDAKPSDPKKTYLNLPSYEEQKCKDDSGCLDFETCAQPTAIEGKSAPTKKYCFVKRDNDGRTGPISYYAQIACETQGGYLYSDKSLSDLSNNSSYYDWIPAANYGLWQSEVTFSNNLAKGAYSVGFPLSVTIKQGSEDPVAVSDPSILNSSGVVVIK